MIVSLSRTRETNMPVQAVSLSSLFGFFLTIFVLTHPSTSTTDSFEYSGCSKLKYAQGTPYESNVNSVLKSLVNSAASSNFNNFKISVPGSSQNDIVYGLFQCRGDLSNSDCRDCVASSVSQLGTLCCDSTGGALQLEGCFVKYDNISFLGVEDKTVVSKKCGPSIGYDSDSLTRRDATMNSLAAGGQYFRNGGSGKVQGMAQCTQDLSLSKCQDCITEAIGRLRSECGSAAWGEMFLATCYARYSERGDNSNNDHGNNYYNPDPYPYRDHDYDYDHDHDDDNDNDVERILAILIGLIAGIALIIFVLYHIRKQFEHKGCK
uniref:Gnk2-homologous domain-containing protein n=1 Tax=Davidia involucrata TaxID=16924 RepID=A0A5B6ZJR5_DAVIN